MKPAVPVYLTRRLKLKPPFSYRVYATVEGEPNPRTGMVVDLKVLKLALEEHVSDFLRRSCLEEISRTGRAPASEDLACGCWQRLQPALDNCRLYRIRLYEEEDSCIDYYGEDKNVIYLTRKYHFCASHRLYDPALSDEENLRLYGICSNPSSHGHNYVLEVVISGSLQEKTGQAFDREGLDRVVQERVVSRFDHKNLNCDVPEFRDSGMVPTGENVCKVVWRLLTRAGNGINLCCIRLIETENNAFEYHGD